MNAGRLIQCVGWLAFLLLLATGNRHSAYVVGWQHGIIIAATVGFIVLLACDLAFNRGAGHAHDGHDHHDHDHAHEGTLDRWLHSAVHLLPLFFVIAVGSTGLGAQAITIVKATVPGAGAQARPAAAPAAAPLQPEPASVAQRPAAAPPAATPAPTAPAGGEPAAAPGDFADGPGSPEPARPVPAPTPAGAAVPLTLTELYFPKKHPGVTRVETVGRILVPTAEDLKKVPADVDTSEMKLMLYRFHMTCCAADARPVFIILLDHDTKGLENETWAKVTGRWVPAPGLGDMAKLVVEKLQIVPPPAEPYLSDVPSGPQP
jgi:hypothetical protein